MIYNVGDLVHIRPDLKVGINELGVYINQDMVRMAGKTARITSARLFPPFKPFTYKIGGSCYNWTELEFVKQVRMK